jgi:hypothetical protein
MKHLDVCLLLAALTNVASNNAYAEPPDRPSTTPTDASKLRPVPVTATVSPQPSPNSNVVIRVDDIGKIRPIGEARPIGKAVTLVGRLGKPLGTKLQLRGRWKVLQMSRVPNYLRSPVRFVVFEVNGNQLAESVEFGHDQIKAEFLKWPTSDHRAVPTRTNAMPSKPDSLDGEEWTMTAYETGRFIAVPNESADKEVVFPVVYALDFNRFRSRVVGAVTSIDRRTKR